MANFKTHITTSTAAGVGYAGCGVFAGMPISTCLVAGGLCSISGMLPDLDSDSGIPVRETVCFGSAVIPVLMLDRFIMMGMSHEEIVLAAGGLYFFVRFFVAGIFKRYTVHRGMWHSLPAAAICGLLAYMICSCDQLPRLYKSGAVVLGFLSHLILDEIYSVDLRNRRIKKSFGTAFKLFSKNPWANLSTYGKLALLVVAVTVGERKFLEYFREPANRFHYTAGRVVDQVFGGHHDEGHGETNIGSSFSPNSPNPPLPLPNHLNPNSDDNFGGPLFRR